MEPIDQIILRMGENSRELPAHRFRDGLFGATLEEALQRLLAQHPNLLPGRQMDPGSDDPPRFFLLRREMPVSNWSLDHLFVDQHGVLSLVETKLLENPESRRDVIGQIIEYAANSKRAWAGDQLWKQADDYWNGELGQKLKEAFGIDDDKVEILWGKIEKNLEAGRFRLIIVGDELRPEIRRIIEYLNREMVNAEVYGLEIRCYGDNTCLVIVPYLVGAAEVKQSSAVPLTKWTPDLLRKAYEDLTDSERSVWVRLLNWAQSRGLYMESTGKTPTFGIRSSAGKRLGGFSPAATWFFLNPDTYSGGRAECNNFCDGLKELKLIKPEVDPETINTSKNAIRNLGELNESEFEQFLTLLGNYAGTSGQIGDVRAAAVSSSGR